MMNKMDVLILAIVILLSVVWVNQDSAFSGLLMFGMQDSYFRLWTVISL